MKPRLLFASLGLTLLGMVVVIQAGEQPAKQPAQTAGTFDKEELAAKEQQLARQFEEFQLLMLKLKQRMERGTEAEQTSAKRIGRILDEIQKGGGLKVEFDQLAELLRTSKLSNLNELREFSERANRLTAELRRILELFEDPRGKQLRDENKVLEDTIKTIEQLLHRQKQAQGQTENGKTDKTELSKIQNKIGKDTNKLHEDVNKFLGKGGDNVAQDANKLKGGPKDGGKEGMAKADAKDDGAQGTQSADAGKAKDAGDDKEGQVAKAGAKGDDGDKSGDKTGQPGEAQAKEGKSSEGAEGSQAKEGKGSEASQGSQAKGNESPKGNEASAKGNEGNEASAKSGDKPGSEGSQAKGNEGNKGNEAGAKEGKGSEASQGSQAKGNEGAKGSEAGSKGSESAKPGQASAKSGEKSGSQGSPSSKAGQAKQGGEGSKAGAKEGKGSEGSQGSQAKSGSPSQGSQGSKGSQGQAKSGSESKGQAQAKSDGAQSPQNPMSPQGSPSASAKQDPGSHGPQSTETTVKEGDSKGGGGGGSQKAKDELAKNQKKLLEAGYDMVKAENKIIQGKNKPATQDQQAAIDNLQKIKENLEKLLRQTREEELERLLAALEVRCRKMLEMQKAVLAGTEQTHKSVLSHADKKADRKDQQESLKLSDYEKEIVLEANKAIQMLEEEGSAVAFPEVFQQVREDMKHVQRRLEIADVADVTQAVEKDIIASLEEMIDALKKAQEQNKSSGKPKEGQPPPNADQKLLDKIAELKMIRSLQKRINDRTSLIGRLYPDREQTADPNLRTQLQELAGRQERIFEIMDRFAKGDGK